MIKSAKQTHLFHQYDVAFLTKVQIVLSLNHVLLEERSFENSHVSNTDHEKHPFVLKQHFRHLAC